MMQVRPALARPARPLQAADRGGDPAPRRLGHDPDAGGIVNAAPYSFFNVFGKDPALIVLGLQNRLTAAQGHRRQRPRDRRVRGQHRDPGAHRVDGGDRRRLPARESEPEALGLSTLPSAHVTPPRLADVQQGTTSQCVAGSARGGDERGRRRGRAAPGWPRRRHTPW